MNHSISLNFGLFNFRFPLRSAAAIFLLVGAFVGAALAQEKSLSLDGDTLIVDQVQDTEIFAFGKTVIVKNHAKGILSFGGDIIVEGTVEGDVATIGGSVIQRENAFIGGDVIIFGGTYKHEAREPLRTAGKETIMYAGYEEELRNLIQNPSEIFAPQLTQSFFAQRLLSVLFWFLISLLLTTISPGAVSRAVTRFRLSKLKTAAIGAGGLLLLTVIVLTSVAFLPGYIGTFVGLAAFIILILTYVFGRVALQVAVGNGIAKRFLGESARSESVKLLIGTLILTILLSIPYVWLWAVFAVWVSSLGMVLTARSAKNHQSV